MAKVHRACACKTEPKADGGCGCRNEGRMQRAVAPTIVDDVLHSSGQPVSAGLRALFEPRFGHDFSRVRVHTDENAAESAAAVGAKAYTVGNHIVFGRGQYEPATSAGRRLMAHELTHVTQQRAASPLAAYRAAALPSITSSAPVLARAKYPGTLERCRGMGVPCPSILINGGATGPLMDCYRARTANLPFAISPGVCIYDMSDGRICSCVLLGTSSAAVCVFTLCDSPGTDRPAEAIAQDAMDAYAATQSGGGGGGESSAEAPPEEMQAKLTVSDTDDPLEVEADRVAESVMAGA